MNMDDLFGGPQSGDLMQLKDHEGDLLLFRVLEVKEDVQTAYGEKEATVCDVFVVDGDAAGTVYKRTMIFQLVLQGQLRPFRENNRMLLGRVGKGEAKKGQNAPWKIQDPTDEDKRLAFEYLTSAQEEKAPAKVPATAGKASAAGSPFA